jgi:hypothetical protein
MTSATKDDELSSSAESFLGPAKRGDYRRNACAAMHVKGNSRAIATILGRTSDVRGGREMQVLLLPMLVPPSSAGDPGSCIEGGAAKGEVWERWPYAVCANSQLALMRRLQRAEGLQRDWAMELVEGPGPCAGQDT